MANGRMTVDALREQVERIEAEVGTQVSRLDVEIGTATEANSTLSTQIADTVLRLDSQRESMETREKAVEERMGSFHDRMRAMTEEFEERIRSLEGEIVLLKRAVVQGTPSAADPPPEKVRVPEPKTFGGARNTKDLENFLWDMEQYFIAARIPVGEQVTITTMYLTGDTKLWWRTRTSDDAAAGRPKIESWEILKKELKDQFLPLNTTWMARESLKKLKQTGSVRDYVKEFSSLILDIKDMSEVDKLFNFMSGLQGWAQTELRRQGVQDLPSAMAATDCLSDYLVTSSPTPTQKGKGHSKESNRKSDGKLSKSGGKGWKKPHDAQAKVGERATSSQTTRPSGCFICDGPHRARDCPKNEKLNALRAEDGEDSGAEAPTRASPLQLLNAMRAEATHRGLMYVELLTGGQKIVALVDSGATHNFISTREAARLGLKLAKDDSKLKAVNNQAQETHGMAKNMAIQLGDWKGMVDFLTVPLDDFDFILGNDFFQRAKVALLSHLNGLLIMDEKQPCFVADISKPPKRPSGEKTLSALQLEKGLRKGEHTYVAAMIEIKPDKQVEVPDVVAAILRRFADVMPPELPKKLPPRR